MENEKILNKLASMSASEIDKLKDKTLLDYKQALHDYHIAKDEELTVRHNKRKELLDGGTSHSKAEQILRADEEFYLLKKKILMCADVKNQTKLTIELVNNMFWKARQ